MDYENIKKFIDELRKQVFVDSFDWSNLNDKSIIEVMLNEKLSSTELRFIEQTAEENHFEIESISIKDGFKQSRLMFMFSQVKKQVKNSWE